MFRAGKPLYFGFPTSASQKYIHTHKYIYVFNTYIYCMFFKSAVSEKPTYSDFLGRVSWPWARLAVWCRIEDAIGPEVMSFDR
jgi:hypothetical protein